MVCMAFACARAYRQRFKHVIVDELQDTSAVQYEWLRKLGAPRSATEAVEADSEGFSDGNEATHNVRTTSSIFAAADDDQSIYGWRGAARDNVLRFQHDWPRTEVIRMAQSYRCSPHVLASALPLLQHADSLVLKSPFTRQTPHDAARVLLRGFWDSTQEGAWIASQIRSRVLGGQALSSIAVLVRSQEQAKTLLPHLIAAGIPVAMQPLGSIEAWWNALEVRCAVNALRLVRSTADDDAARELLRAWAGLSANTIDTLQRLATEQERSLLTTAARALQYERLPRPSASRLTYLFARFAHWQSLARQGGLKLVLDAVASDHAGWCTDGGAAMRKLVAFALRCGSLAKLLEHSAFNGHVSAVGLHDGSDGGDSGHGGGRVRLCDDSTGGGNARGNGAAGGAAGGVAGYAAGGAARQDTVKGKGAISLLTIHRAKGLEWDTVFLPGWEQGTFPLSPSTRLGSQGHDEEWRLAYVALTRAKHFAGITHASRRNWQGRWEHVEPSNFLQVLPSSSVASFAPNKVRPFYHGPAGFRATNAALFSKRRAHVATARTRAAAASPAADSGYIDFVSRLRLGAAPATTFAAPPLEDATGPSASVVLLPSPAKAAAFPRPADTTAEVAPTEPAAETRNDAVLEFDWAARDEEVELEFDWRAFSAPEHGMHDQIDFQYEWAHSPAQPVVADQSDILEFKWEPRHQPIREAADMASDVLAVLVAEAGEIAASQHEPHVDALMSLPLAGPRTAEYF